MRQHDQQENIRPIHKQLDMHFEREWFTELDNRVRGGGPARTWRRTQAQRQHLVLG